MFYAVKLKFYSNFMIYCNGTTLFFAEILNLIKTVKINSTRVDKYL
jgi:hypothetical protein